MNKPDETQTPPEITGEDVPQRPATREQMNAVGNLIVGLERIPTGELEVVAMLIRHELERREYVKEMKK